MPYTFALPVHAIEWGIWSYRMNAFITKEHLSTWVAAERFMHEVYGERAIAKEMLEVRPRKIHHYSTEDI